MKKPADPLADFQDGQRMMRNQAENASQSGERAKRKAPEQCFGQNGENKKINRKRDHDRDRDIRRDQTRVTSTLREQEQPDEYRPCW